MKIADNSDATITNANEMKKGVLYQDREGDIWTISFPSATHKEGYICFSSEDEPFVIDEIHEQFFPLTRFEGTISN